MENGKKPTRRDFLKLAGAVSGSSILAACAPAQPAATAAAVAPATEKTKVNWLLLVEWSGTDEVAAEFMADNPDIELVLEKVPFNDLFTQIQIRFSAGSDTPDIVSVDVPLVSGYGVRKWLAPLDDLYTPEQKADLLDAAYAAGSHKGSLIGAPQATSTQLLFINKELFDKAGIPVPGPDDRLTYEQIADMAQKLTQDTDGDGVTDIWGFTWEQTIRIYQLQAMMESLGGQAIGDDGLTAEGVINSKPWVDAYTYYSKAFNEWKFAPPSDVNSPELFSQGKLAMMIAGPWQIGIFSKMNDDAGPGFDWSVSRHPYFEGGEIVTPTGSWHIGINTNSKNKEAAMRVLKWCTTSKGAELWNKYIGDFPAQKSVLALIQTDPKFQKGTMAFMKTAADEATVNPVPRALTPGFLEYEQILQTTFDDISTGADVQGALDTAAQRIQREMDKYR